MRKEEKVINFIHKENENITLSVRKVAVILREIEYISVSLKNISDYYCYAYADNRDDEEKHFDMCKEMANFVCKNNIIDKILSSGHILAEKFNDDIIENINMGDLEKEMEGITFWEKPGD